MSSMINPDCEQYIEKDRKNCIPTPVHLELLVVNPCEVGLEGAEFSMFYGGTVDDCPFGKAKSNHEGIVRFCNLPLGDYIMLQTLMPAGHKKNEHIYRIIVDVCGIKIDGEPGPFVIINTPEENGSDCEPPLAGPPEQDVDALEVLMGINPGHRLSAFNSVSIDIDYDSEGKPTINAKGSSNHVIEESDIKAFYLDESNLRRALGIYRGKTPKHAYLKTPAPAGKEWDLYSRYGWDQTNIFLTVERVIIESTSNALATLVSREMVNNSKVETRIVAELSHTVSNTIKNVINSTHGISASANVGVQIKMVSVGLNFGYNYSWGTSNEKESSSSITVRDSVETVIPPESSVLVRLMATERQLKATVVYRAFLNGQTAYHYDSPFEGHYFWASPISKVMAAGNIPNSMTFTETIEIGMYSDGKIIVSPM